MQDKLRYKLHNKYKTPHQYKKGDRVFCHARKRPVEFGGYTDGFITWIHAKKTGIKSLILCDDLIEAVKYESEIAIAYWFGVSIGTVYKWRKALNVGNTTEGTKILYEGYYPEKITQEIAKIGRKMSKTPEAIKKLKSKLVGRKIHENTRAALLKSAKQPKSVEWKRKHSETLKRQWKNGTRKPLYSWSENEKSLLGTNTDRIIAEKIGRTLNAVRSQRYIHNIPSFQGVK